MLQGKTRTQTSKHNWGKIKVGSGGCYLDPPGYPTYFYHVASVYGDTFSISLDSAIAETWLNLETRIAAKKLIDKWQKPPLNSPRTQEWINHLFNHFKNCYSDPTKPNNVSDNTIIYPVPNWQLKHFHDDARFSEEWRIKELAAIAQANNDIIENALKFAKPENHQATRLIRKYYPDFLPSQDLIDNPPKAYTWYERHETKPTPETCQGESWQKHPVNVTWCQVCGWHQEDNQ